jgi:nitrite reductase/ring-hydroxylating ferredoxin subunit
MSLEPPDIITIAPDGRSPEEQPRWRQYFPIDAPQDDYRSRRDFARFLLLTSLAFVVGQAWIVLLSVLRRARGQPPAQDIAGVAELPVGGVRLFAYPRPGDACVLVRVSHEQFVAYGQKCTHLSCPVIPRPAEERFHCPCHEGAFDLRTGQPLAGPPRRPLPRVTLEIRHGRIYATRVHQAAL